MRAGRANSSGNENGWHEGGEGGEVGATPLAGFEPGEGSQRIADANGPSRCGEALDLLHPPSVLVRERWAFAQRWQEEVTDGELH